MEWGGESRGRRSLAAPAAVRRVEGYDEVDSTARCRTKWDFRYGSHRGDMAYGASGAFRRAVFLFVVFVI